MATTFLSTCSTITLSDLTRRSASFSDFDHFKIISIFIITCMYNHVCLRLQVDNVELALKLMEEAKCQSIAVKAEGKSTLLYIPL